MFIFHVMLTLHFLSSETPLLCLHTLDSGKHLLAVISCPTARPSPFHHTTQKPLPLTELGSATTSTQVLQRCVDIVFLFSHDRLKKFCVLGYNLGWIHFTFLFWKWFSEYKWLTLLAHSRILFSFCSQLLREINNMIKTGRSPNMRCYAVSLDRDEEGDGSSAKRLRLDGQSAWQRRLRNVFNDRITRMNQDQV